MRRGQRHTFITAQYDDQGRKVAETNQLGLTRRFEYDPSGRLAAVELPGVYNPATSQIVSPRYEYGYDAQGNQTLIRDPLDRETWFTFDAQNRQVSRTLPLGFGDDGIRGTGDDPVRWTIATDFPANMPFTERMTYDAQGRQHLHISFEGVVTEHVYSDTTGRLIEKRFFDNLVQYDNGAGTPGEVWTYTHDAFGRVVHVERQSLSPATTATEATTYDAQGRIASVANDEGTISYTYDRFGRLASTTLGTHAEPQRIISYTYDQLGRLKTVSEDQDPADSQSPTLDTAYGYTLQGSLRRTDLPQGNPPQGTIEEYVYDGLNRLDLLTVYGPDETPEDLSDNPVIARFDYTVQADGRRTALVEQFYEDGQSTPFVTNQINWQYDALGRLIEEDFNSSDNSLDYTEAFLFDLASNRIRKTRDLGRNQTTDETTTYEYDANDRLWSEAVDRLAADDSLTEYDWLFTQQIEKTVYTGDTATSSARVSSTEFSYDLQGRLHTATVTQYSSGNPTRVETTTYDYNSSGIRVSALTETDANGNGTIDSRVRTEFLNDANNHTGYSQVLRESHYDADTDQLTKTIDYTFGHAEISQTTREYNAQGMVTSEATLIFGHDGHGSVRVVTDLAAAAVQFYAFDAYGQMLAIWNGAAQMISGSSGQYADPALALTNLLYSGEQFDTRVQMQYLRARWYDAATGRFIQRDPILGHLNDPLSLHKYAYVHADPVNGVDPTGQMVELIGFFVASGLQQAQAARKHAADFATYSYLRMSLQVTSSLARARYLAAGASYWMYYNATLAAGTSPVWIPRVQRAVDVLEAGLTAMGLMADLLHFTADSLDGLDTDVRGRRIEEITQANVRGNVSGIDDVQKLDGGRLFVTSIRSHDVESPEALRAAIRADARELFDKSHRLMSGTDFRGQFRRFDPDNVMGRGLVVAIPGDQRSFLSQLSRAIDEIADTTETVIEVVPMRSWRGRARQK